VQGHAVIMRVMPVDIKPASLTHIIDSPSNDGLETIWRFEIKTGFTTNFVFDSVFVQLAGGLMKASPLVRNCDMNKREKHNLAILFEYIFVILVIFISLILSTKSFATEPEGGGVKTKQSHSVGRIVKAKTQAPTKELLKKSLASKANKNKEQLGLKGLAKEKVEGIGRAEQSRISSHDHYFSIHDAVSYLLTDIDQDGYYHEFSVRFDADTLYGAADVYAELYLSLDGGPWQHYYSSDIFTIYGDSVDDQYEVMSTLVEGYPPGHYDILIDLYEVGVEGVVATFSSDDSNSLYALPLEDSTYDVEEVVVVVESHGHGGSSSEIFLSLLLLALGYRLQMQDKNEA